MIPSFLSWMESDEVSPLTEPQHKRGEGGMRLDAIVERRMKQIIMDLESSGKGTQEEILAAVQKYLSTKGVKGNQAPQQQNQQAQEPAPNQQAQSGDAVI
jgi:hypothetical protein